MFVASAPITNPRWLLAHVSAPSTRYTVLRRSLVKLAGVGHQDWRAITPTGIRLHPSAARLIASRMRGEVK